MPDVTHWLQLLTGAGVMLAKFFGSPFGTPFGSDRAGRLGAPGTR